MTNRGFDQATATRGACLNNREDRLGAISGILTIDSAPALRTTITGTIPTSALAPVLA